MYCQCGCGEITKINTENDKEKKWIKGQHKRFIYGHQLKKGIHSKGYIELSASLTNKLLCKCGCGEYLKVSSKRLSARGLPKYIHGHHMRTIERRNQTIQMNEQRTGSLSPRWKENRDEIRGRIRCKVDFTKRQKRDIYIRDNGICQNCGIITRLDVSCNHPEKTNIDHIFAVENGGVNMIVNGQVLCLLCHKQKHSAKANRMNSGKPRTGNPEPSVQSTKVQRLLEYSDILNNQISVRLEREEIVQA